ncbi:MAG: hypothetical protein ACR2K5_14240, partial [Pseudolabrys sp.]
AHLPHFSATLWSGMREPCASEQYTKVASDLRADIESAIVKLRPPPIASRLRALGYSDIELDDIRAVPEMLSHGNYLYVVLTTAARYLLEGGARLGNDSDAISRPPCAAATRPARADGATSRRYRHPCGL